MRFYNSWPLPVEDLKKLLWFSKHFKENVYAVMFQKRFINILHTNVFYRIHSLNLYKVTHEARFDCKRFLNIYKINEEMKVMLEMFFSS